MYIAAVCMDRTVRGLRRFLLTVGTSALSFAKKDKSGRQIYRSGSIGMWGAAKRGRVRLRL